MKIIYPQEKGKIALVCPTGLLGVQEVARKDVPYNVPYLIVQDSDIPQDWSVSLAWDADFLNPHGYGLGAQRWFIEQAAAVIANPESTPEEIEEAMKLSEQMQDELAQMEGAQ